MTVAATAVAATAAAAAAASHIVTEAASNTLHEQPHIIFLNNNLRGDTLRPN